jgi:hypothetical protein
MISDLKVETTRAEPVRPRRPATEPGKTLLPVPLAKP